MGITITCPYCKKDIDFMQLQIDNDLRFVFTALPSFGQRYSSLVMAYVFLFGVTPFSLKSKKLRILIDDMKRLFDAQAFSYQKKTYQISHTGIAEALELVTKKNFPEHLENHNYLKRVMMTIAEREAKDGGRKVDAETRQREDMQRAMGARKDYPSPQPSPTRGEGGGGSIIDPELRFTPEQRQRNLQKLGEIIKSIG